MPTEPRKQGSKPTMRGKLCMICDMQATRYLEGYAYCDFHDRTSKPNLPSMGEDSRVYRTAASPAKPQPARQFCGICGIERNIHEHPTFTGNHRFIAQSLMAEPQPAGEFAGFKIMTDPSVPPGEIHIRNVAVPTQPAGETPQASGFMHERDCVWPLSKEEYDYWLAATAPVHPIQKLLFDDTPEFWKSIGWRVVHNAGRRGRKMPRWAAVEIATGHGSGYSADLCRYFGLDPNQEVGHDQED